VAKVTMPQLGESVAEGTIGRWLKQPGDAVAKYEALVEVVTDKVNAEVPSPYAGILREILAPEGSTVPNNADIAVIETAEEAASGAIAAAVPAQAPVSGATPATAPTPTPASGPTRAPAVPAAAAQAPAAAAAAEPEPAGDPNARMTPAVRRLVREHGLDPAQIVGTGGGGRITRVDVLAHVEALRTGVAPAAPVPAPSAPLAASAPAGPAPAGPAPAPTGAAPSAPAPSAPAPSAPGGPGPITFPPGVDEVLVPMTTMRKGVAAQMTRSLQAPHAYIQMEIDATRLVQLRDRLKGAYQAKEGIGLSFVPFVVKASADALKRNPTFNAHWTDQGLVAHRKVNVGVAVAMGEGLIVPVIRGADLLSIHGLNVAITDVANRARANRLKIDDFGGGTFTVDNTGYLGTNLVMPILNVPEVGIVTMEAITKRPVVVSGPDGDVIAIRSIMNMVLAIDHRANDGAAGAALLRDIKAWLEGVGPDTSIY
jgi:2-oxoisovalerate dehydrogenase E2 component (dihydrolipoyl transacylase)